MITVGGALRSVWHLGLQVYTLCVRECAEMSIKDGYVYSY